MRTIYYVLSKDSKNVGKKTRYNKTSLIGVFVKIRD